MAKPNPPKPRTPCLVVADTRGRIFDIPDYLMAGVSAATVLPPDPEDLIPLPYGSDLFMLPGRVPVGLDPSTGRPVEVPSWRGEPVFAVAAFMAPAHMQILRAAYRTLPSAPPLPFYAYTAVGWMRGRFHVTGVRTDPDRRQDLKGLDIPAVERRARELLRSSLRRNRLARHLLENCVLRYGCPAARNFVLGRHECPLPTSPACNARCLACISEQPCETCGVKAPQDRIGFVPTPEEIAEVAVSHIGRVGDRAVVSFGQGCEGEPLLVAETLEEAVRLIRRRTSRGTINLNTNASLPDRLERLFRAGLDSVRISLNSCRPELYHAYFRPQGYGFDEVLASARLGRRLGRWVSLNYFIFPGLTDTEPEYAALRAFLRRTSASMIQTRNLNMDPEWYISALSLPQEPGFGMREWLRRLRRDFPRLRIGYFNPPLGGRCSDSWRPASAPRRPLRARTSRFMPRP